MIEAAVKISPFDTGDKRYVNDNIVNVTYHATDWIKCFRPGISSEIFEHAIQGYMLENIKVRYTEAKQALIKMSDGLIRAYANYFIYGGSPMDFMDYLLR